VKLTEIANRLREVATGIESAVKSDEDDFDFPNDMVIPFITNAFVDLRSVETFVNGRKDSQASDGS
jgi:hypothetical protein